MIWDCPWCGGSPIKRWLATVQKLNNCTQLTLPLNPFTGLDSISCSISFFFRISCVWVYETVASKHAPFNSSITHTHTHTHHYCLVGINGGLHIALISMPFLQIQKKKSGIYRSRKKLWNDKKHPHIQLNVFQAPSKESDTSLDVWRAVWKSGHHHVD